MTTASLYEDLCLSLLGTPHFFAAVHCTDIMDTTSVLLDLRAGLRGVNPLAMM